MLAQRNSKTQTIELGIQSQEGKPDYGVTLKAFQVKLPACKSNKDRPQQEKYLRLPANERLHSCSKPTV